MKIVISGATEAGVELARGLSLKGNEIILMDKDTNRLQEVEEHLDVMTLAGDATRRTALQQANVGIADGFVAVSDEDNNNVLAAALAKTLGAKVTVARMDSPDFYVHSESHEMNLLGVDVLLCPTRLVTTKLVDAIMSTHLPFLDTFANASIRVALVRIGEHSEKIGRQAAEITYGKRGRTVAVVTNGYLRFADRVAAVESGDALLVVGAAGDMLQLWRNSLPGKTKDRAFIVGGGDVGASLAGLLSKYVKHVEIVEKDPVRASEISARLSRVTVLSADARSTTFLKDQQIDSVDYLMAATGDDEVNLLVSLVGRKLGAPSPSVVLHRPGYMELYKELGINGTVGIHEMIANYARYAVMQSGLVRYEPLPQTNYIVSEWRLARHPVALTNGELPMSRVPLPENVRIIGVSIGTSTVERSDVAALSGGETLLLLGPDSSLGAVRKSIGKLLQERHS